MLHISVKKTNRTLNKQPAVFSSQFYIFPWWYLNTGLTVTTILIKKQIWCSNIKIFQKPSIIKKIKYYVSYIWLLVKKHLQNSHFFYNLLSIWRTLTISTQFNIKFIMLIYIVLVLMFLLIKCHCFVTGFPTFKHLTKRPYSASNWYWYFVINYMLPLGVCYCWWILVPVDIFSPVNRIFMILFTFSFKLIKKYHTFQRLFLLMQN